MFFSKGEELWQTLLLTGILLLSQSFYRLLQKPKPKLPKLMFLLRLLNVVFLHSKRILGPTAADVSMSKFLWKFRFVWCAAVLYCTMLQYSVLHFQFWLFVVCTSSFIIIDHDHWFNFIYNLVCCGFFLCIEWDVCIRCLYLIWSDLWCS